jgi:hypothetical protein
MSVQIIFTKKEILDRVNVHTINISDPVGSKEQNTTARIADVIPLTNDDVGTFYELLWQAGIRVLEYIGAYTDDVDNPYLITGSAETPETVGLPPDSIIFEMEYYEDAKEGIVTPIVQQAMAESLIFYIVKEWCKMKNFLNAANIVAINYNESLPKIKSGLMYGQRVRKKYRIM